MRLVATAPRRTKLDALSETLDAMRDDSGASARSTLRAVANWTLEQWACLAVCSAVAPPTVQERVEVLALLAAEAQAEDGGDEHSGVWSKPKR